MISNRLRVDKMVQIKLIRKGDEGEEDRVEKLDMYVEFGVEHTIQQVVRIAKRIRSLEADGYRIQREGQTSEGYEIEFVMKARTETTRIRGPAPHVDLHNICKWLDLREGDDVKVTIERI
jgi:hypothetical protein